MILGVLIVVGLGWLANQAIDLLAALFPLVLA